MALFLVDRQHPEISNPMMVPIVNLSACLSVAICVMGILNMSKTKENRDTTRYICLPSRLFSEYTWTGPKLGHT